MLSTRWKVRVIHGAYYALAYFAIALAWLPFIAPCATQYLYGTLLDLQGDDAAQMAPLTFTFPFYCQDQSAVGISTNGIVSFGSPSTSYSTSYSNDALPTFAIAEPFVAPFWTDLILQSRGIYTYASNDTFVVQWTNMGFYGMNVPLGTFQAA